MKIALVVVLLAVSLAANAVLWRRTTELDHRLAAVTTAPKPYPLGEMMGYMQRYADKLWFAADAGNWDLARFYHDEIAETDDDIAAAHASTDDGIEVSQRLATQLPPALRDLDAAVISRDHARFRTAYENTLKTCNACHQETQHGFIQVAVPSGSSAHWNQRFAPR
jgi:hypothetical protein